MTTPAPAPSPPAKATPVRGSSLRRWMVIATAAAAAIVVAAFAGGGGTAIPLDPDNAGGDGARAVARVLADQGVDLTVVRSADVLESTTIDTDTTVVVTSTESLGSSTARRLLATAAPGRLVIVDPSPLAADALSVDPGAGQSYSVPIDADCSDPALGALLDGTRIDVSSAREFSLPGCFRGDIGSVLAVDSPGLVLLGAPDLLTNDQVLRGDNAAVALRLLGTTSRLVWYIPNAGDLTGSDGVSLRSLLPASVVPALWLTLIAGIALLVWRGRRLGALVTEPLPVTVKAIETTQSRGRLYRKAADRSHAAAVLRAATARRCRDRLRLPPHIATPVLIQRVADHLGRPADSIAALLDPAQPAPRSDSELITLGQALSALEDEVRDR